ncbi:transposase [Streptomyces sp. NPDC058646]|uniref:transposase n=1 Tax=Streptomyces sp. NPDC058646 TaxID=3346574 RepID=UPI003648B59D
MQSAIRPTALITDDRGLLKDGCASVYVTRLYTGTAGEVTHHQLPGRGVAAPEPATVPRMRSHWRLFLPKTWDPASPKADPVRWQPGVSTKVSGLQRLSAAR